MIIKIFILSIIIFKNSFIDNIYYNKFNIEYYTEYMTIKKKKNYK